MNNACYFVSDLHLFANRSKAWRYGNELRTLLAKTDHFVLGGDIFDFCWARTANHAHTVEKAINWLVALIEPNPHCRFYFVLGNHDYYHDFINRLASLQKTFPNFLWHRYYVRIGTGVFLHGDVADRHGHDADTLAEAREAWLHRRRHGRMLSRLYDAVVLTRLHKPVPHLVYPKRIIARRILYYLEKIGQGPRSGVKNVYFGHTHKQMSDYAYGGLVFHNGGAPIKGVKFRILEAAIH